ncbi:MAG: helix-turn-helix transcriptional regulator [Candidatus Omnitrophota bacterium]|nr:MAG: helix-turn-helix transcriptional regulator [Candidatus Omnitrophota bacterium]
MRLKEYLKEKGLKPSSWAEENGLARSVISRYLHGYNISPSNAMKIVVATEGKVSLEDIYLDTNRAGNNS